MPTLVELLERGYLPKELPPPFTSASYAAAVSGGLTGIPDGRKPYGRLCGHNLARPGMIHRRLSIPDPIHYWRLAENMTAGWADIAARTNGSAFSLSSPESDPSGHRALIGSLGSKRLAARAEHGSCSRFLVKADVAQYYSSVYTHTFAWALHGKDVAKHSLGRGGLLGDVLDEKVRDAQDGQTIGIPVGPDSSFALGELVLSAVDEQVADGAPWLHGFRYFDDYELFTATRQKADAALATLQSALSEWQLALNPYKVKVFELPEPIEQEWVTVLKRVQLKNRNAFDEQSRLYELFDEAFRMAKKYPQDSVLAYAIGRFVTNRLAERTRVRDQNWRLFEQLLLQSAIAEQGTLARVTTLLYWYQRRGLDVDPDHVAAALNSIVIDQASRGHGSEVAWSLYAAICLGIALDPNAGMAVSAMLDDVVALVSLHAQDRGLLPGLDTTRWQQLVAPGALEGEHWLLAYQAPLARWLTSSDDQIGRSPRFGTLRAAGVSFYDVDALPPAPPATARPFGKAPAAPPAPKNGAQEKEDFESELEALAMAEHATEALAVAKPEEAEQVTDEGDAWDTWGFYE